MPTIAFAPDIPIESGEVTPLLTAIRIAVVERLESDPVLLELIGGSDRIFYRPRRTEFEPPALTYFDFGAEVDPLVPMTDRTMQIDVWETDLDRAERIALRVRRLLDLGRGGGVATPLVLEGTEGRVANLFLTADRDGPVDGDFVRKSLDFRVMAYDAAA
jgi:hypothetical protein